MATRVPSISPCWQAAWPWALSATPSQPRRRRSSRPWGHSWQSLPHGKGAPPHQHALPGLQPPPRGCKPHWHPACARAVEEGHRRVPGCLQGDGTMREAGPRFMLHPKKGEGKGVSLLPVENTVHAERGPPRCTHPLPQPAHRVRCRARAWTPGIAMGCWHPRP